MRAHLRANLFLLALTVLLCSVLYPLVLLGIGQTMFPAQAQGSLVRDADGNAIGSRLIAQPFAADEYFQPRPSAASYNGAASGASNWAASNYALRNRVARQLGPLVKYRNGPQKGRPVAPDIEAWFQKNEFGGKPGIVAQWATLHPGLAKIWVTADKMHAAYVATWQTTHREEVVEWIKAHPDTPEPKPEELATAFFVSYSQNHPGTFPVAVEHKSPDGKAETVMEPVKDGPDIQAVFFEMWLESNPDVDLQPVPADMVMASGSGLDPHITLANALWQLDRVAAAWAPKTGIDKQELRDQIEQMLRENGHSPLGGLVGGPLVHVLGINLALRDHYRESTEDRK